jgi:CRP-like cAMP-binding protein
MGGWVDLATVSLLGLATTSSTMLGATIGLYARFSKRVLACILAFAAGSLISALAIELAFQGAQELHHKGFNAQAAWGFIGGGFALGALLYYWGSRFLEKQGAAVRYPTRFREYALERKQEETKGLIEMLAKCDLLRHLPPEEIEQILLSVRTRRVRAGEIVFQAGDPGDALYIVAHGKVEVLADRDAKGPIARLTEGHTFGEMALLSKGPRTATIRAAVDSDLLQIDSEDFDKIVAKDRELARAAYRLSHERALANLSAGGPNPATWAQVATHSLHHLSRDEENKMLAQTGHGAGLAIALGNLLDTIPGLLVVGSKFTALESLSFTLMLGMFLGGIPEGAASAAILTRAGFRPKTIYLIWSTVLIAGILSAAAGKLLIGSSESLAAIFAEGVAGGAVLGLVAQAMIPEAIHDGGSLIVLPTVAGFLFALYLALAGSLT